MPFKRKKGEMQCYLDPNKISKMTACHDQLAGRDYINLLEKQQL